MYSIQEVSERIKDQKDIPIGLLYNIATVLEVDASFVLFGKGSTQRIATAVYNGNGIEIERYEGYSFISLNADFVDRQLEPMIVTIDEGVTPELVKHTGQEFNYVLEGALRVIVGEKEFYLRAGDSLYFDATLPHAQVAMSKSAKFITVIQK